MRTKNQETLDRILKFVNKYYQEYHSSPTINDVAEGVGVARSTTHRYLQELSDRNLIDYSRGILSAPQSAKMKTAYVSAPLVGSIRCGNPEDEEESIEEYVSLPVSMFGKGDFYILRAKGDSMVDAGIDEDDLLVIEQMCEILSISTKTGYRILREGKILSLKVGRAYRIPKAHLFTYLCIGCVETVNS